MEQYIPKAALAANIEARYNECLQRAKIIDAEYWNGKADAYRDMLVVLDTLEVKEEHVSEDLEEAAIMHFKDAMEYKIKTGLKMAHMTSFKAGAQWQFEKINKALLSEVLPCFMHGGEADEVVAKFDKVLNKKEIEL